MRQTMVSIVIGIIIYVLVSLSKGSFDLSDGILFLVAFAALGLGLSAFAHAKAHHHNVDVIDATGATVQVNTSDEIQTVNPAPQFQRPSLLGPTQRGPR